MKSKDACFQLGLPIVDQVAHQVSQRARGRMAFEDLQSIGRIALLQLIRLFKPGQGSFASFASCRLRWAMVDALRRETHGRCLGSRRARPAPDSQRPPVAGAGSSRISALKQGRGLIVTFQADLGPVRDSAEGPESVTAREEVMRKVKPLLPELEDKKRVLVERHYLGSERIDCVAADLGISPSWAGRLARAAVAELAARLGVRPSVHRRRSPARTPRSSSHERSGSGPSSSAL